MKHGTEADIITAYHSILKYLIFYIVFFTLNDKYTMYISKNPYAIEWRVFSLLTWEKWRFRLRPRLFDICQLYQTTACKMFKISRFLLDIRRDFVISLVNLI